MLDKKRKSSERAFKEACKKNGLVYKKHDKGIESDCVRLIDEGGSCFKLNKDLSIKKCSLDEDNDYVATIEPNSNGKVIKKTGKRGSGSITNKKSSYKIQKGLQKA